MQWSTPRAPQQLPMKHFIFLAPLTYICIRGLGLFAITHFRCSSHHAVDIVATFCVQLILCSVLDKFIGNSESTHLRLIAVIGNKLKDCATHTALNASVLDG